MSELAADLDRRPRISSRFRLQWEEAQDSWVLLYPEGMVKLNRSAGEIMQRCDGGRSIAEAVAELEQAFGVSNLQAEVCAFLDIAVRERWVTWS